MANVNHDVAVGIIQGETGYLADSIDAIIVGSDGTIDRVQIVTASKTKAPAPPAPKDGQ